MRAKLLTKLTSSLTLSAFVMSTFSGTAMANAENLGNGSYSRNSNVQDHVVNETAVQKNEFDQVTRINASVGATNMTANDNTGGDVLLIGGHSSLELGFVTIANRNKAFLGGGSGAGDMGSALNAGNGSGSRNFNRQESEQNASIFQNNEFRDRSYLDIKVGGGDMRANRNTGGDVVLRDGDNHAELRLGTAANDNWAAIMGHSMPAGWTDNNAANTGNGSHSYNRNEQRHESSQNVVQDNMADVWKDIKARIGGGSMQANDNTGGDVILEGGHNGLAAEIETIANKNMALLGHRGAAGAHKSLNAGNGSYSDSENRTESRHAESVFQDNVLRGGTELDLKVGGGYFEANRNTGGYQRHNDPAIFGGDSFSEIMVRSMGNANFYGGSSSNSHLDFDFEFDLDALFPWW